MSVQFSHVAATYFKTPEYFMKIPVAESISELFAEAERKRIDTNRSP